MKTDYFDITQHPNMDALLIPLDFALAQILGLNVSDALRLFRTWQQKLIALSLDEQEPIVFISNQQTIDMTTLQHFYAGEYSDRITSTGVALLKHYIKTGVLAVSDKSDFPASLEQYIAMNIESSTQVKQALLSTAGLSEEQFTYGKLFYLFDSLVGTRIGKETLSIGHLSVSRTVKQLQHNTNGKETYEIVFMWENDTCRTQYLRRN